MSRKSDRALGVEKLLQGKLLTLGIKAKTLPSGHPGYDVLAWEDTTGKEARLQAKGRQSKLRANKKTADPRSFQVKEKDLRESDFIVLAILPQEGEYVDPRWYIFDPAVLRRVAVPVPPTTTNGKKNWPDYRINISQIDLEGARDRWDLIQHHLSSPGPIKEADNEEAESTDAPQYPAGTLGEVGGRGQDRAAGNRVLDL